MPTAQGPASEPPVELTADPAHPAYTRLYISPLTVETLKRIVTLEQLRLITDTSFHTLPAFPEKSYAYLTLPQSLAQSIRKKYHGNIFKGVKMKIEEARPERRKRKTGPEAEAEEVKAREKEERRSKRKRGEKGEEGVLKGIELPEGRKVKRGWSDLADDKKLSRGERKSKSAKKEDGESQLVFRTSVPPTAAPDTANGTETSRTKAKKSKRAAKDGSLTEVKEGEKTTKFPTFLRTDSKGEEKTPAAEYVDGKGWVDAQGQIVEAAPPSSSKRRTRATAQSPLPTQAESAGSASSSEVSSSNDSSADEASPALPGIEEETSTFQNDKKSTPNISITTPDADASADHPQPSKEPSALEALFKRPNPSTSSTTTTTATTTTTKSKPAPISTRSSSSTTLQAPFSFFPAPTSKPDSGNPGTLPTNNNNNTTAATNLSKRKPHSLQINPVPSTPFTRRDLDARSLRSAAPTPDTAAIGRRFRLPVGGAAGGVGREREGSRDTPESVGSFGRSSLGAEVVVSREVEVKQEEEEDGDEDEEMEDVGGGPEVVVHEPIESDVQEAAGGAEGTGEAEEQNEFERHFYEHRGEYNRAWKANKREARKGARQAENRKGLRGKG